MMITVTEKRFGEYHKDDKAVSLRNRSGTCGGGSEVMVIYTTPPQLEHCKREIGEESAISTSLAIRN